MNRKEFKKQLDARFDAFKEKFYASFDKFNVRLDDIESRLRRYRQNDKGADKNI